MIETILSLIMALGIGLSFIIPSPTQVKEIYTEGKNYLVTGNYDRAEKNFRWIIDVESPLLNKDSIRIVLQEDMEIGIVNASRYQLGNLYKKKKEPEKAIREFEIVVKEARSEKLRTFSQYQVVLSHYESGNYTEAIDAADKLIKESKDDFYKQKALYNQAWSYYKLKEYDSAVRVFDALASQYPDSRYSPRALFQEGQIQFDQARYREAADAFMRLIQAYAPEEFSEKDWSKIELKKLKRLQQKSSMQSKNQEEEEVVDLVAKAYLKAGESLEKAGELDKAYALFQDVTKRFVPLQDMVETAFLHMAEIKFQQEGIESAVNIYQKALEESEKRDFKAKMQYQKAKLYQEKGYYDKAIQEYRIYLKGFDDVADNILFPVSHAYFQIGESYYAAGAFKDAAIYYSLVADSFPGSVVAPNSLYNLALSLDELGNIKNAIEVLDTLRARYPENPVVPNAIFQQARFYADLEDYSAAINNYQYLIRNDSLYSDFDLDLVYIDLGLLYKDLKRYELALKALHSVKSNSSYYPGACSAISEIYLTINQPENAINILTEAISTLSDSAAIAEFRYYLARVYIQLKRYPEALEQFDFAIAFTDKNEIRASSLYGRGFIYYQQKDYHKAVEDFLDLLEMKPITDLVDKARERLIFSLINLEEKEQAFRLIRQWLSSTTIPDRQGKLFLLMMQAYNRIGEYGKAVAVSDTLLSMDISDNLKVETLFYRGTAFFQGGNYSVARETFRSAMEKYPGNEFSAQFLYQTGMCEYLMQDYLKSAETFLEFIDKYPEDRNLEYAYYYRAFSFLNAGEWAAARDEFGKLLKKFPETELKAEIFYQIAETFYNSRDYANARKSYLRIVREFAESPFIVQSLYNTAWCLIQLDSTKQAMEYFMKIVQDYPASEFAPFSQYTLGDYYYNQKEYDKAISAYQVVVQRYPDNELAPKAQATIHEIRQINSYLAYQKAMELFDNKQYEEAIIALEKVVKEYPEADVRIGALVNIGAAYEQLENYEMALRTYDRVVQSFREDNSARDAVQFAEQHIEYIKSNY